MKQYDLNVEINSLQFQIEDQEKKFDVALLDPKQLANAKQIYKDIKVLEGRLLAMRNLFDQETDPGDL
jgi:cell division protein FtsL